MKKCPYCAEEIQDAVIGCRFCGRDLATAPPSPPPRQQPAWAKNLPPPRRNSAAIGIGIVFALSVAYSVEGQVKNLTGRRLEGVQAVTTWYTKDDAFTTSDSALIDFDPLLAGQTSPFKTISRANPEMSGFRVEFKFILGGTLASKDSRKIAATARAAENQWRLTFERRSKSSSRI